MSRTGVVHNRRSHANRLAGQSGRIDDPDVLWAEPDTQDDLARAVMGFAAEGVDLLVIDGGDGTVRDVLSVLPAAFGDRPPLLAVVPSGKTNVLALDLGAKPGWTVAQAIAQARQPAPRTKTRPALEISWADPAQRPIRGFIVGCGAFVRGTQLSRTVNKVGAFHGLSVALTIVGAAVSVLTDSKQSEWRRGVQAQVSVDGGPATVGARFVLLATTLKRLPLGLAPFGTPRDGMKVLDVDAPPRRLLKALPPILAGREEPWLAPAGYRRGDAAEVALSLDQPVVIDGEIFPGGELVVRQGPDVQFLAP